MALGFANVDYTIKTRLSYNLNADEIKECEDFVKANKIKALYEKLAILNIMSFDGYSQDCLCTRTEKALKALLTRRLITTDNDTCHLR